MTAKQNNLLVSVLFFLFGLFVFVESLGIKKLMQNDVGSAFFPKVIALAIMAMAAAKLILTLIQPEAGTKKASGSDLAGGWMTVMLLAAYVLVFQFVGFILSTAVYLFLQMLILAPAEKRKLPLFAIISVAAPIVIYGLFVYVINMPLPKGLLGF